MPPEYVPARRSRTRRRSKAASSSAARARTARRGGGAAGPSSPGSPGRSACRRSAAYWPVRLIERLTPIGSASRSWPATWRCRRRGGPGWPGCAPSWSCPRRSGRAGRRPSRSRRQGRRRRATRWPPKDLLIPVALTVYGIYITVCAVHSYSQGRCPRPDSASGHDRSGGRMTSEAGRRCRPGSTCCGAGAGRASAGRKPGCRSTPIVDGRGPGRPTPRAWTRSRWRGWPRSSASPPMSLYRYVTSKDELLQLMWNASAAGRRDAWSWRATAGGRGCGCGRWSSARCSTATPGSPRCRWPRRRSRRTR